MYALMYAWGFCPHIPGCYDYLHKRHLRKTAKNTLRFPMFLLSKNPANRVQDIKYILTNITKYKILQNTTMLNRTIVSWNYSWRAFQELLFTIAYLIMATHSTQQYEAQLLLSLSTWTNYCPVHSWTHLCTWHRCQSAQN